MDSFYQRISLIILLLAFNIDPILGNVSVINGLKNQELVIAGPDDNYAIKELIISNIATSSVAIEIRLLDTYSLQPTLDTVLIPGNSIDTISLTLDFYHIYDLKIVRQNSNQIIHQANGIGGVRKVILVEGHSQAAGFKGLNYNHYPGIKTVILNNNSLNWYQAVADNYSQISFVGGFAFGLAEKYHLDQGGENVLVYNHAVSGSILPDLLPGTSRFEDLKKVAGLLTYAEEMVLWIGGNDAYQDNQNGLAKYSAWALFRQRMEQYKDSVFDQLGIKRLFLVQEYAPVFSYYPDAEYLTGYGKELLEMRSDTVIVVPSTNGQFLGPNDLIHWGDYSLREIAQVVGHAMEQTNYEPPEIIEAFWVSGLVSVKLNKPMNMIDSAYFEGFWGKTETGAIAFPSGISVSGSNQTTFDLFFNTTDTIKEISFGGGPLPFTTFIPAVAKTVQKEGLITVLNFPVITQLPLEPETSDLNEFAEPSICQNDCIIISPNPTQGIVKIVFPAETQQMEILTLAGEILFKENVEDALESTFDISFLSAGIYIVQCTSMQGGRFYKKISLN